MADQVELCKALKKMADMVNQVRNSSIPVAKNDGVVVAQYREWQGAVHCKWPNCETSGIHESSWTARRGSVVVEIWEIMFHYAQVNHWISFSDISEPDQTKLIWIFS